MCRVRHLFLVSALCAHFALLQDAYATTPRGTPRATPRAVSELYDDVPVYVTTSLIAPMLEQAWGASARKASLIEMNHNLATDLELELSYWLFEPGNSARGSNNVSGAQLHLRAFQKEAMLLFSIELDQGSEDPIEILKPAVIWNNRQLPREAHGDAEITCARLRSAIADVIAERRQHLMTQLQGRVPLGLGGAWLDGVDYQLALPLPWSAFNSLSRARFDVDCERLNQFGRITARGLGFSSTYSPGGKRPAFPALTAETDENDLRAAGSFRDLKPRSVYLLEVGAEPPVFFRR